MQKHRAVCSLEIYNVDNAVNYFYWHTPKTYFRQCVVLKTSLFVLLDCDPLNYFWLCTKARALLSVAKGDILWLQRCGSV